MCGVALWGWLVWVARRVLSRRFCFAHPPRTRCGVLYSDTLSARDVGGSRPTPHGFAYCESSSERWVGSPAGQYLPSRPSSVFTWVCASTLTPAEPHALTATRPLGHSLVFPHLDVKLVYLVDLFIARSPHNNAHTTSLVLTLSGDQASSPMRVFNLENKIYFHCVYVFFYFPERSAIHE